MTVTINGPANAASSGSGTVTHTAGDLTANQVVIGNGTADLKTLGSLGTTSQYLQGNAAGAPSWATPAANPTASVGLSAVNGSAATFLRSDGAPALDVSIVPTWTAVHTFSQAVAATSTDGVVLSTTATATSGNQKYSPRARFRGSYFSGSAKTTDWIVENQPTSSGGALVLSLSDNGGAYSTKITFDSIAMYFGSTTSVNYVASGSGYSEIHGQNGVYFGAGAGAPGNVANVAVNASALSVQSSFAIGFTSGNALATLDTMMMRAAAANIRFGAAAANSPVAQTLSVQNASGTDIAGASWTFTESLATGNAKGGGFQWQLGTVGASGTTLQTAATKLDLGATTDDTLTFGDAVNIAFNTTTGTKIGTGTTQKLGFYGATPIVQGASVADPSGGAVVDSEARTAIIAVITRLEALGLIATV